MSSILTTYDWIYGIAQFAAVILSIIAGILAVQILHKAAHRKTLAAWRWLTLALILFTFEEILGTLEVFGVFKSVYLTHVLPSFILGLLITALVTQININRGCTQ